MTDNLFDRLADLFRSPGPVNWRLAREIAESVAGPAAPIDPWAADQLLDLVPTAQRLVAAGTPLDATALPSPPSILDRRSWAGSTSEGLTYLAAPIAERMGAAGGELGAMLQPLAPSLVGMQVGALSGLVSRRVCASFDRGIIESAARAPTFVPDNLTELADGHDLDRQQVTMWAALREVAHQAILEVPWTHEHLEMLGDAHAASTDIDDEALQERLRLLQDPDAIQRILDGGDTPQIFDQPTEFGESHQRLTAFYSVIEGCGAAIVRRVGAAYLPDLDRIEVALDARRSEARGQEGLAHGFLGVSLDPGVPSRGTTFCNDVARRWGDDALDRLWEGPDMLPTDTELDDPTGWAARVLL
ncbi:MAG: zinc-dependent metalloprotease [Acidimicrobiia bacterium]